MRRRRLVILCVVALLPGCATRQFALTDQSAVGRLMATRHVAALRRKNPSPLIAWVERSEPGARALYLGENHLDHTVRVGSYRVTADGRVWVNADPTLVEERWTPIE